MRLVCGIGAPLQSTIGKGDITPLAVDFKASAIACRWNSFDVTGPRRDDPAPFTNGPVAIIGLRET